MVWGRREEGWEGGCELPYLRSCIRPFLVPFPSPRIIQLKPLLTLHKKTISRMITILAYLQLVDNQKGKNKSWVKMRFVVVKLIFVVVTIDG